VGFFRFHRSFQIIPGFRFNLSKRGGSVSLGAKGATVNLSARGTRTTLGIPGTGLSYISQQNWETATTPATKPPDKNTGAGAGILLIMIIAMVGYVVSSIVPRSDDSNKKGQPASEVQPPTSGSASAPHPPTASPTPLTPTLHAPRPVQLAPALPSATQSFASVQQATPFQQGLADRRAWETWFAAASGEYRRGALYWAGQRSLVHPGSCATLAVEAAAGCSAAVARLAGSDVRRKNDPDYRAGWNSF
jgi:hypothetical protein